MTLQQVHPPDLRSQTGADDSVRNPEYEGVVLVKIREQYDDGLFVESAFYRP